MSPGPEIMVKLILFFASPPQNLSVVGIWPNGDRVRIWSVYEDGWLLIIQGHTRSCVLAVHLPFLTA